MLPQDRPPSLPSTWQSVLRDAVRSIDELAALLDLPAASLAAGAGADRQFPLLVPRGFIARMRRGDPHDPLLRQVLPDARETISVAGYTADPLDESRYAAAGLIRKYPSRALVVATAACPVHCRYCFRREFPYAANNAAVDDWGGMLADLARSPDVGEVILSGGDPLALSDNRLERLLARIAELGHIDTVRIHTRFPIMIPERITERLGRLLATQPMTTVVVVHANHPQEIDDDVDDALAKLAGSATALLNQSVLLRGVNDDAATLAQLSRTLFRSGALPYYLHMPDRVTGTAHFAVADSHAIEIVDELRSMLPGYLVPRLMREIPGRLSKTPLIG